MTINIASPFGAGLSPSRRQILKTAPGLIAAAGAISSPASAQQISGSSQTGTQTAMPAPQLLGGNIVAFNLAHEQFPVPELVQLGANASQAGFGALGTSDHLQPWQANEGHAGQAWVTLGAVGAQAPSSWIGTMVTCPTIRYNPAVVAEAFASLSLLYPGGYFPGSVQVKR